MGFGSTYGAFRKEVITKRISQRNRIGEKTTDKFATLIGEFEKSALYKEALNRFLSASYESDRKKELLECSKKKIRQINHWQKRKVYEKTERYLRNNDIEAEAFKKFLKENHYSMEEHFRITAWILLTMIYITETTI